jgi:PAS domain S-box-containing protein
MALDITERKKLEDQLEKFRLSVEHSGDSVFWVNREGRILYTNASAWKTLGYKREEILNISIFDLDPDYQEGVWSAHFEDLKKRGTITLETRHRTKDGRIFPIEVNANYVCIGGQEFNFATVRDISLRKEADVRIFENDRRLRAIFEQAGVGVIEAGTSANLLRVNKRCCQMLGYSEEELLSKTMADLTHPDDMPMMHQNWQLLLEGKTRGYSLDKRYIAKNGEDVWVNVIVSALWSAGKSPDRVVAIVQNITPQKKAEVALSKAEFRYRTIFEQAGVGVAVLESRTGRFVEVNLKNLEILGRSDAEVLATDFMSITHPDDLADDLNQRRRMRKWWRIFGWLYRTAEFCKMLRPPSGITLRGWMERLSRWHCVLPCERSGLWVVLLQWRRRKSRRPNEGKNEPASNHGRSCWWALFSSGGGTGLVWLGFFGRDTRASAGFSGSQIEARVGGHFEKRLRRCLWNLSWNWIW